MRKRMMESTKNTFNDYVKRAAVRRRFAFLCGTFVLAAFLLTVPAMYVNASSGANVINTKFNTLIDIATAIISSIGTLITLWGLAEWGISFQGQDGIMQAHAFKRVGGGLVTMLSPQLLKLFTS